MNITRDLTIAAFISAILAAAALYSICDRSIGSTVSPNASSTISGLRKTDLTFNASSVVLYEGHQIIYLSNGNDAEVSIEVTTKGNGLLTIQEHGRTTLTTPIFDLHQEDDDYFVFDDDMLDYDFVGNQENGFYDLIITGRLIFRNETAVKSIWQIRDVYRYDDEQQRWHLWETAGPEQWRQRLAEWVDRSLPSTR
mgnify:CR=1 FL=1